MARSYMILLISPSHFHPFNLTSGAAGTLEHFRLAPYLGLPPNSKLISDAIRGAPCDTEECVILVSPFRFGNWIETGDEAAPPRHFNVSRRNIPRGDRACTERSIRFLEELLLEQHRKMPVRLLFWDVFVKELRTGKKSAHGGDYDSLKHRFGRH